MCEPATIIAGVGLGMQVLGGQQQARASASASEFDASVAMTNAANAERTAADIRTLGHEAEVQQMRRVRALTGQQRTGYAAANVDSNSGTALDVIAESAGEGMADASRIRSNALREAWGYTTQAGQLRQEAAYGRRTARATRSAGILTGGGQLLGGGYALSQGK